MKHLLTLLGFLTLALASNARAQTLTRGPLIQNPDALTTTITIEWWTDVSGDSRVEYGLTPSLGSSKTVATAGSCEIGSAGTCHAVQLTGLQPGTRYYYRLLTNNVEVLATTYFQTFKAPTDTSELLFTVIGDFGQNSSGEANVANNMNATDPPLLMTVGDNAYTNGTQSDWDSNVFIPAYENGLLRRAVFMTTLGNHDLNDVGASNWQSSVEIKLGLLPRNAPSGQEERFYSFDDGDAHFIVLDANPPAVGAVQNAWLANDLATNQRKWVFVFLHQTPYSCANGIASIGSSQYVRDAWGPLFEQYGVDIVFDGHDHIYERSGPVDDYLVGGGTGSDGLKTLYVMTGGGGASLDSAANSDSGGPYRQPLFGSKSYCPWLSNQCPNGVGGQWCSFSRFQHVEVRVQNDNQVVVRAIDQNNSVFDQFTVVKSATCGNSIVESGEQCDQGSSNGTTGSCCSSSCQFKSNGTTCRTSAGVCDPAETCSGSSGTCPVDAKSTGQCRAANGACDVAESCDGVHNDCPADGFASSSVVCRPSAGVCDVAENCTGSSAACPADSFVPSTTQCRAAVDVCDQAENCTGSSAGCPADGYQSSGTVCRPSAGGCDAAETCTGLSPSCPADVVATFGTVCRNSAGACDVAETCDGVSGTCPPDGFASSTTVCRAAAGTCDVAETCTGSSPLCPADVVLPSSTVCRPSAGVCDISETCTGTSGVCPTDAFRSSSTVCRASTGACDAAELCTGSAAGCPIDVFAPSTTVCRPSTGACDLAETCTGSSSTCPADALAPSGTVCRAAASVCDVAETCNGSSASCPADAFAPSTTQCRAALGVCDVAEFCTGSSGVCPPNGFQPPTTECRPALDVCDQAEFCSGSSASCPANLLKPVGTVCRAAVDVCDAVESCNGTSVACPADQVLPSTTVCRPSTGICDIAETCTGASTACPADTGQPDSDGDGVCDLADDCPSSSDPGQVDSDGDGIGDACDPCNNYLPVFAVKPNLQITKLATPPGDDKFKFAAQITVPATPAIDPLFGNGVRVILTDSSGATVLDAQIPGGLYSPLTRAGWRANGTLTSFNYRNAGAPTPLIGGIYKVVVSVSTKVPGLVKFQVQGKNGSYALNPAHLPLTATFILDPPYATTNQCGEAVFPGPSPACTYTAKSGVLKCK